MQGRVHYFCVEKASRRAELVPGIEGYFFR